MNAPFIVAQAATTGQATPQTVRLTKPANGQALTVQITADTRIDFSAIASDQITLVRVGNQLVILFDNQATLSIGPFFDASGRPLDGLAFDLGNNRVVDGQEFAGLFPITTDQTVLPASGNAGGGDGFGGGDPTVDALGGRNPLDLLGNEDGTPITFSISDVLARNGDETGTVEPGPTAFSQTVVIDEDGDAPFPIFGLPDANPGGPPNNSDDPTAPLIYFGGPGISGFPAPGGPAFFNFGSDGPATLNPIVYDIAALTALGLTSGGIPIVWTQVGDNLEGRVGPAPNELVVGVQVLDLTTGDFAIAMLRPLDHPAPSDGVADETGYLIDIPFTLTDGNGTQGTGTLTVNVNDDSPIILPPEGGQTPILQVTETGLGASDPWFPTTTDITLGIQWGADNFNNGGTNDRSVTVADQSNLANNVTFTGSGPLPELKSNGVAIEYVLIGGVLVAYTGSVPSSVADANVVFSVAFSDTGSGQFAFTLRGPLDHPRPDPAALPGEQHYIDLAFNYAATDSDGDPVYGAVTVRVDAAGEITFCGCGNPTIDYSALPGGVFINLDNRSHTEFGQTVARDTATDLDGVSPKVIGIDRMNGIVNATGTDSGDVIIGGDEAGILLGLGGNDLIRGRGGDDAIDGGDGDDTLHGGRGWDEIHGGIGDDTIRGGADSDLLLGEDGDDTIRGGRGRDVIFGDDMFGFGPGGNDTIDGGRGADEIYGGAGDDMIRGGRGADYIEGNDGDDTIRGGSGQDVIFGDDVLSFGSGGNDTIYGGSGDDLISGGGGDDAIYGGSGNDGILGGFGNDTIRGGRGDDLIEGSFGDDIIYGGRGDDLIDGGFGNDLIRGGRGDDGIFGGFGNDEIYGGRGDDFIDGGFGNDTLYGGRGSDQLVGGAGTDTLDGGSGIDSALYVSASTSATFAFDGNHWTVTIGGVTDTLIGVERVEFSDETFLLVDHSGINEGGFQTIQDAVDNATGGETVLIAPGPYAEQVQIEGSGKDGLTLQALTAGTVTVEGPATLAKTADSPTSGRDLVSLIEIDGADNVTITGITVDGQQRGGDIAAAPDNGTLVGIAYLNSDGGVIDNVTVTGIRESAGQFGNQRGVGIYVLNTNPSPSLPNTPTNAELAGLNAIEIRNSTVVDFQKTGIVVAYADVNIHDNTVTGIGPTANQAQNGIQVSGSTGTVADNIVTAIGYTGANWASTGILTFENVNLVIDGNTVTGTGSNDLVIGVGAFDSRGVSVTGNTFTDVQWAIDVEDYPTASGWPDPLRPGGGTVFTGNTFFNIGDTFLYFNPDENTTQAFSVGGTSGYDAIYGAAGDDTLRGAGGDDYLEGRGGDDEIHGGAGSDTIVHTVGDGSDIVDGGAEGAGADILQVTNTGGATTFDIGTVLGGAEIVPNTGTDATDIQLSYGATTIRMDEIEDIELTLGSGGDTVNILTPLGGTSLDVSTISVEGGAGDDTVNASAIDSTYAVHIEFNGNGGNDTFTGGAGADIFDGGETLNDADTAIYAAGASAVLASGSDGDDFIVTVTATDVDTISNIEFINIGGNVIDVTKTVWVLNDGALIGTFDTIADAATVANSLTASGAGIAIEAGRNGGDDYNEGVVTLTQAMTIRGVGGIPGDPVDVNGQFTVSGTLNGEFKLQDVAIDASGRQYGLFVDASSAGSGSITLDGVSIQDAVRNGVAYIAAGNNVSGNTPMPNANTIGAVSILHSSFENNGSGQTGGAGDILLYGYNGDLTITDVQIDGSGAHKAIQMRGLQEAGDAPGTGPYDPAGNVSITDLTITGSYTSDVIAFYRLASLASFTAAGVSITASAAWALINFDSVGGNIDLSSGIAATNLSGGRIAELQGLLLADALTGTDGNDLLLGRGGDDTLTGGGGDDTIVWTAGAGNDLIDGGETGESATGDTLAAMSTAAGQTISLAAPGDGGDGFTVSDGAGTADVDNVEEVVVDFTAGSGTLNITGDFAASGISAITVEGGSGSDVVDASAMTDSSAGFGVEIDFHGNGGDDTFFNGARNDTFTGGTGTDTAVFSVAFDKSDVAFAFNALTYDGDRFTGVERLEFSNGTVLIVDQPGGTHDYDGGYASIAAALAAASAIAGPVILYVTAGIYAENVAITRDDLTIIGDGDSTVIQGVLKTANGISGSVADFLETTSVNSTAGIGVSVAGDNVTIEGVKITSFNTGIGLNADIDGLTLRNVTIDGVVDGIRKGSAADVTNLTIENGTISDGGYGISFYKTSAENDGMVTNVSIDGTHFENLLEKGIYAETLSEAEIANIEMTNVGKFGRPQQGEFGNGIDINLKYESGAGEYQNIHIHDFIFTDVGTSDGAGAPGAFGGAIVIKARDDAPGYSGNPAAYTGTVVIENGTITGTSTGIRAGEPGKTITGPAVTVTNVTIDGEVHNAQHGDIDNVTNSLFTVTLTDAAETLIASPTSTGSFDISGLGGNDIIAGGQGDDTLRGGNDDDNLQGEGGDDTFIYAIGEGHDVVDGGAGGTDVVDVTGTGAGEDFFVETAAAYTARTGNAYAGASEVLVSSGSGILVEATGIESAVIHGGGGNDTVDASAREFRPAVGQDFPVSTANASDQVSPQITALANGGFAVTWQSRDNGANYDIRGQVFAADGTPIDGSDFLVSTSNANHQFEPQITALANGGFAVTWRSDDSGAGNDIRGQVFAADGTPIDGSDFLVSTANTGSQEVPQITALANGGFAVTWASSDNGANYDIRGQVFAADGTPIDGSDFLVSTTNASSQLNPQITALANGGFAVTWQSLDNGANYDIRGQVFAADGTPIDGSDFLVSTANANEQLNPQITALPDGGFVVTWHSGTPANYDIRGRVFAADGTPVEGSDFLISTTNANAQTLPDITALPDGGFAVTWHSNHNGVNYDIRGRVFDQYGVESAVTFDGGADNDVFRSGAGNDIFRGGDDNDTAYYRIGDGRDIVDGGTETTKDILDVTGTGAGENFFIEIPAEYNARVNPDYAGTAEILVSSGSDILVEASEIEDIVIHGGGGADNLTVSGSFTGTSLLTATITYDSGAGDDTLDLRDRDSNHRVVADGGDGADTVVYGFARASATVAKIFDTDGVTVIGANITHTSANGPVTDVLRNFESFQFSDGTFDLNMLFNQAPDAVNDTLSTLLQYDFSGTVSAKNGGVDWSSTYTFTLMVDASTRVATSFGYEIPLVASATLNLPYFSLDAIDITTPIRLGYNTTTNRVFFTATGTGHDDAYTITLTDPQENIFINQPTFGPLTGTAAQFNFIGLRDIIGSALPPQVVFTGGAVTAEVAASNGVKTEDTPFTVAVSSLIGNDSDADGDPLTFVSVQGAVGGTVSESDGYITFTPAADYFGAASFTYTIRDGAGLTDTATVSFNINNVSEAPALDLDGNDSSLAAGGGYFGNYTIGGPAVRIADSDTRIVDPDGDNITSAIITLSGPADGASLAIVAGNLPASISVQSQTATSITLTGSASAADYETAIESITFSSSSASTTQRSILVSVFDGNGGGAAVTSTIFINSAPAITSVENGGVTEDAGASLSGPNLVANGGFHTFILAPSPVPGLIGTLPGWTLQGTSLQADFANFVSSVASLQINGLSSISQNITTVAGQRYQLSFWADGPTDQTTQVTFNGGFLIDARSLGANDPFRLYTVEFEGTGGPAELKFTQPGFGSSNLDDVAVRLLAPSAQQADSGIILFTDANTGDTHGASFAAQGGGAGYIGTFSLDAVDQSGNSVGWDFVADNSALQFLGAGETQTQYYDVTLTDNHGGSDTETVTVTLIGVNDAPEITSNSGNPFSVKIDESTIAVTTVVAADPEGAALNWSLSGTDATLFDISNAGVLTFRTAPNFEAPIGGDNIYNVTVTASDGLLSDTQAIEVTVQNRNDAPVITSDGGTPAAAVNVDENTTAVTDVNATDEDGDTLSYLIAGGADAAAFQIDATTGVLSFQSAPDFEARADVDGDNRYDVIVRAFSGGQTADQALSVVVGNVNDAPVITGPNNGDPYELKVSENTNFVTTIAAIDAEGVPLSYTIVQGVGDAGLFEIGPTTGILRFTPARAFVLGGDNTYEVIVEASDGVLTDTQTITVDVLPANAITYNLGSTPGSSVATATDLTNRTYLQSFDPQVGNATTNPSITINAAESPGNTHFYSLVIAQNDTLAVFDIDQPNGFNFDTVMRLLDSTGLNIIAENDDRLVTDPGSGSVIDPFLSLTLDAGTYYLQVGELNNSTGTIGAFTTGLYSYDLQVSAVAPGTVDPLVLDLDGNGFSFGGLAHFDMNGDGHAEALRWMDNGDGLLVSDRDGSGAIENGHEVFSPWFAQGGHADSLAALQTYDSNGDGVVDAHDERFGELQIWVDANGDGVTDDGELSGLMDAGVAAIDLAPAGGEALIDGQHVFTSGQFTTTGGESGQYVGVELTELHLPDNVAELDGKTRTGTDGADTFALLGKGGADTVFDYSASEGDRLDLTTLLDGNFGEGSNIADFVKLTGSGSNVTVQVDADGAGGDAAWTDVAMLSNYNSAGNQVLVNIEQQTQQLQVA